MTAAILASCGHPAAPTVVPNSAGEWRYDVALERGGREVVVDATFPPGTPRDFVLATRPIDAPRVATEHGWARAGKSDEPQNGWRVEGCAVHGCRLHYRVDLAKASEHDDVTSWGASFLADPSTWLVAPSDRTTFGRGRVRFRPAGDAAVIPSFVPDPDLASGSFELRAHPWECPPALFGVFGGRRIDVGGRVVEVALVGRPFRAGDEAVIDWVRARAALAERFYGRFPAPRAVIVIAGTVGDAVGHGQALGGGQSATIVVDVGSSASAPDLRADWVLLHEIVHLALPSLPRRHHWLEEGLATYIEPLARVRAGELSETRYWTELVRQLPNGQPDAGDEGIDNTPTWGRTYWGGALFCLVADVAIRVQSKGAASLDDALRAIVSAGGNIGGEWDLARVLTVGDAATGLTVLHDLHAAWASRPVPVDLADIWTRLGVRTEGDVVVGFDEGAALAPLRRAMTQAP